MGTPHESRAVSQERRQRRVAVKFVDGFELRYEDGAEKYFLEKERTRWKELVDRFPGITLKRVYTTVPLERIQEMVDEARKRNPEYQPPDFSTFFVIDVSSQNVAEGLAAALTELKFVEYAYVESLPVPPPLISYLDAPTMNQGALPNMDIGGINAVYAWGKSGGTGKGVNFIDIEKGWCLDHPDLLGANGLPKIAGPLVGSVNYGFAANTYSEIQHGTSVLGILAANDKGLPWKGIAYEATGSVLSPWCDAVPFPGQPAQWNIADAIMAVNDLLSSGLLSPGDVLLLELQVTVDNFNGYWPIECEANNFYPIELATQNEIVVIEAAGNGGSDFDNPSPFNTNNPNYNKDSGAIIVGAANPQSDQVQGAIGGGRYLSSNFGTRVNCFAWGDSVDSLDADPATGKGTDALGNPLTTDLFGGTSAASAIIAGAAIVLQGICQQPPAQGGGGLGHRLTPADMRARLSDFSTGTLSVNSTAANPNADRIGVMPNLELIMNKLGIP